MLFCLQNEKAYSKLHKKLRQKYISKNSENDLIWWMIKCLRLFEPFTKAFTEMYLVYFKTEKCEWLITITNNHISSQYK